MRTFDFDSAKGQQAFERFILELIRREINSYARQVLFDRSSSVNIADASSLTDSERIARLEQTVFRG
jgi:hypothetical protein